MRGLRVGAVGITLLLVVVFTAYTEFIDPPIPGLTDEELWSARRRYEALRDIEQGRLVIRSHGLPGGVYKLFEELVLARTGVEYENRGCIVMPGDDTYNQVMKEEIARRLGRGVFENRLREIDRELRNVRPRKGELAKQGG